MAAFLKACLLPGLKSSQDVENGPNNSGLWVGAYPPGSGTIILDLWTLGTMIWGPASLAIHAPRNNSLAARSAAAVAGSGKASEADRRRGEPSKPTP